MRVAARLRTARSAVASFVFWDSGSGGRTSGTAFTFGESYTVPAGSVTALRAFIPTGTTATTMDIGLWSNTGTLLRSATGVALTVGAWNEVAIAPVAVTAGQTVIVGFRCSDGSHVEPGSTAPNPNPNHGITANGFMYSNGSSGALAYPGTSVGGVHVMADIRRT